MDSDQSAKSSHGGTPKAAARTPIALRYGAPAEGCTATGSGCATVKVNSAVPGFSTAADRPQHSHSFGIACRLRCTTECTVLPWRVCYGMRICPSLSRMLWYTTVCVSAQQCVPLLSVTVRVPMSTP